LKKIGVAERNALVMIVLFVLGTVVAVCSGVSLWRHFGSSSE